MSHNVKLKIYCDGGARGNPGPAAVGFIITDEKEKTILKKFSKKIGIATNNVAEYSAVVEALEWLKDFFQNKFENKSGNKLDRVDIFLDSQLVERQLNGFYKIKNSHLRELIIKVHSLEREIGGDFFYRKIPREKNFLADQLVNFCLDQDR